MGWFDKLRGRFGAPRPAGAQGSPQGAGSFPVDEPAAPGLGGPHFYSGTLSNQRWLAQGEAINLVRNGLDPSLFPAQQMRQNYDQALLADHHALRHQLSDKINGTVLELTEKMAAVAAEVATRRVELRTVEAPLDDSLDAYEEIREQVDCDPEEQARYEDLTNPDVKNLKHIVFAILVFTELIMTAVLMEEAFPRVIPVPYFTGAVVGIGVLFMFVLLPHYAAHMRKAAVIASSKWDFHELGGELDESGEPVVGSLSADGKAPDKESPETRRRRFLLARAVHSENANDRGSRLWWVMLLAVALFMVPLAILRADHVEGDRNLLLWLSFFFLLQLAISVYFYMREWKDYGEPSRTRVNMETKQDKLIAKRTALMADHIEAMGRYEALARSMWFNLQQAEQWDAQIMQAYLGTVYWTRHAMQVERPDLHPFLYATALPHYHTLPSPLLTTDTLTSADGGLTVAPDPVAGSSDPQRGRLENPVDVSYRLPWDREPAFGVTWCSDVAKAQVDGWDPTGREFTPAAEDGNGLAAGAASSNGSGSAATSRKEAANAGASPVPATSVPLQILLDALRRAGEVPDTEYRSAPRVEEFLNRCKDEREPSRSGNGAAPRRRARRRPAQRARA